MHMAAPSRLNLPSETKEGGDHSPRIGIPVEASPSLHRGIDEERHPPIVRDLPSHGSPDLEVPGDCFPEIAPQLLEGGGLRHATRQVFDLGHVTAGLVDLHAHGEGHRSFYHVVAASLRLPTECPDDFVDER